MRAGLSWEEGTGGVSARAGLSCQWGVGGLDYAARSHPLGPSHLMSVSWRTLTSAPALTPAAAFHAPPRRTPLVLAARPPKFDGSARRWRIEVRDSRNRVVKTLVGTGMVAPRALEWDGLDDHGRPVLNLAGVRVRWEALDRSGQRGVQESALPAVAATPRLASPDGRVRLPEVQFTMPRTAYREWRVEVRDGPTPVWAKEGTGATGAGVRWNGRDGDGRPVELAEPRYAWRLTDEAGEVSAGQARLGVVVAPIDRGAKGDWIRLSEIVIGDGENGLSEDVKSALDGQAALLMRYPDRPIEIVCVARAAPGDDSAESTARHRADDVLRHLVEAHGLRSKRIIVNCRAAQGASDLQRVALSVFTGE